MPGTIRLKQSGSKSFCIRIWHYSITIDHQCGEGAMTSHPLDALIEAKDGGATRGLASICSAHPVVLEATLRRAVAHDDLALIEATCNQVNQDGGYTGMRPADFHAQVVERARAVGLEPDRLLLGGDHLGPNPWRAESAADAMGKAERLVEEFATAGYRKLHLDASMHCADDDSSRPLRPEEIAERTARLAAAAETAATAASPPGPSGPERIRYVIGTEVPVPGGAAADDDELHVTTAADVAETLAVTRAAFVAHGAEAAWERVRLVVAQPGVEFSDAGVHKFVPEEAVHLAEFIEREPALAFEAHSTDYQTVTALRSLVQSRFVVLKVGPALTNAYREGVFALSYIEDAMFESARASGVREVLDAAMRDNPIYWSDFYAGDAAAQHRARQFSRSDRSRYYWPVPSVASAVATMSANLRVARIPDELLAQFMPVQFRRVRDEGLRNDPDTLLRSKVDEVLNDYFEACRSDRDSGAVRDGREVYDMEV
jgi:D-tagatose-1,6-bisphosphate aldolase subunit GatZ/KbaZ